MAWTRTILGVAGTSVSTAFPDTYVGNLEIKGPRPWIDVRTHGAKGDGTTDDTTAIQDALTAAGVNGRVLFPIPSVKYKMTGAVAVYAGQEIFGAGYGSLIEVAATATFTTILGHKNQAGTIVNTVTDLLVHGLRFKNTAAATLGIAALRIGDATNVAQRVRFTEIEADGCQLQIGSGVAGIPSSGDHRIDHCYVHDTGTTIDAIYFGNGVLNNCRAEHNLIKTVGGMGIGINSTGTGVVVHDNIIISADGGGASAYAIDVNGSVSPSIRGNYINSKFGINSENPSGGSVLIDANTVIGTVDTAGTGIQSWRTATGQPQADQVSVTNNAISKTSNQIVVADQKRVLISSNKMFGAGRRAIDVTKTFVNADDVVVRGNSAVGYGAVDASAFGLISGSTNVLAEGNYFDGKSNAGTVGIGFLANPSYIFNNVLVNNAAAATSSLGAGVTVRNNVGWVTENSGTGTIASGATTAVVTHGLSVTPTLDDISIVFGEQGTADYGRWWVDTITSTQFTLRVSVDPGASNLDFAWRAVAL